MIKIENSFLNNDSYIINNYLCNGVHIVELNDVKNYFSKYNEDDFDKKLEIINQTDNDKSDYNELVNHESNVVRAAIACLGNDNHRKQLSKDKDKFVRQAVVKYGNDEIRWNLINDEHEDVLSEIAYYGTDEMRDKLISNKSYYVRSVIAEVGNNQQKNMLINDESDFVLMQLLHHVNKKIKEKIKKEVIDKNKSGYILVKKYFEKQNIY